MLESQRLTKEISTVRAKVNRMPEFRSDDPEAEKRMVERSVLVEQLVGLDEKLVEAMDLEDKEAQAAMARSIDVSGLTPEQREYRELAQRTNFENYVMAALGERQLTKGSAEEEYNQHVFGDKYALGEFPMEMLLDREEQVDLKPHELEEMRTIIASSGTGFSAAGSVTFIDRIFATSDGAYLGAQYPAVGPGRHSYPVVSGNSVAAQFARGAAETPAGTLNIESADPTRIQKSYEYSRSDELQIPGIGAALQRDARMALMAGLDNKVIDDLLAALTDPTANSTIETLALVLGRFGAAVDGRGAVDVRQVRILCGTVSGGTSQPATYAMVSALTIANIGHFFNLMPHDRFRGSSHIAATASKNQAGIAYRTGMPGSRRLLAPVWRRAEILRDTGRLQTSGQVTLTAAMYADVIIANTDLHTELDFRTIA